MTEHQLSDLDHPRDWLDVLLPFDSSSLQQQLGISCPDCSCELQPGGLGLNLVCCTACGCSFCGRCKALYLLQPGADTKHDASSSSRALCTMAALGAQQQTVLAAVAAADGGLLATCSCELVDKAAVERQWGPEAVACWPRGQLQQQLLLLLLLQQYQQQVVPLLSQQLLQQLQQQWSTAEAAVLQWQDVQDASQAVCRQQQEQRVQTDGGLKDQQWQQDPDAAPEGALHVIPTSATPAFQVCQAGGPVHTPMDMDFCDGAAADCISAHALSAAKTAAAASQIATGAAYHSRQCPQLQQRHQQQQDAEMQLDEHASHQYPEEQQVQVVHINTVLQQQQQQQRQEEKDTLASSRITSATDGTHMLQQTHEQSELMKLAQQVFAANTSVSNGILGEDGVPGARQEETFMTNALPAAPSSALTRFTAEAAANKDLGRNFATSQHPHQQTVAIVSDSEYVDGQLDFEDFAAPQQHCWQQQQSTNHKDSSSEDQHWEGGHHLSLNSSRNDAQHSAVLHGKGGRMQLVSNDGEGASSLNHLGSSSVPQISDFGLQLAPPMVADEPVVLIVAGDQDTLPFWQR